MLVRSALILVLGLVAVTPHAEAAASRPKLVVFLAVDQMRADYIDQYQHQWKHGLRRLLTGGAHFRQASFPYLGTVTCPGHATLGTGAYPRTHGMILNTWFDRATAKSRACTDDPAFELISYGGKGPLVKKTGESANFAHAPTLADEMRRQLGPSTRVVSFSLKPRSAIGLGGKTPDAVMWREAGHWVTSTAFSAGPVPLLQSVIAETSATPPGETTWAKRLDERLYKWSDDGAAEKPPKGWEKTFPHDVSKAWGSTPLADRLLARIALATAEKMRLGRGKGIDYLAISFSTLDAVGHAFGPRSHEVQDILANLDVTLGELLKTLDARIGAGNYVVALSADHGVAELPEQLTGEGRDAGRVSMTAARDTVNKAIAGVIGPGKHVVSHQYTDLYLAPGVHEKLRGKPGAMTAVLKAAREIPGIAQAYSTDELRVADGAEDPIKRAASLSHFPERSGEIVVVPKRHWINASSGTTHGTSNDYDQHVPVLFYGAGVKPGQYDRQVTPADVAPTLAALVGITLPAADGKALSEAISTAKAAGRTPRRKR